MSLVVNIFDSSDGSVCPVDIFIKRILKFMDKDVFICYNTSTAAAAFLGEKDALKYPELVYARQLRAIERAIEQGHEIIVNMLPLTQIPCMYKDMDEHLVKAIVNRFNQYDNQNYVILRTIEAETIERQVQLDMFGDELQDFLDRNNIKYVLGESSYVFFDEIVKDTLRRITNDR